MATSEVTGSSPLRPDRSPRPEGTDQAAAHRGAFESILFDRADDRAGSPGLAEPDFFGDLNLDQILDALTEGREEYELQPYFYAPLRDVGAVRYRHDSLRELERPDVLVPVRSFAEQVRRMREHLDRVAKLHYVLQKQAWFLDAVDIYCTAVGSFADELAQLDLVSSGFRGLRAYLEGYTGSEAFRSLLAETTELKEALAGVQYALRIHGPRVTVTQYAGEADYSAEVEETFARFKQGAVKSYLVRLPDRAEMDHVEEQILACVARLYPQIFRSLADYCARHEDYLDETVARFDREVQFYLAYLELTERVRAAGLEFCYPHCSARSKEVAVEQGFDLALAIKLLPNPVVVNDFRLAGPERVFVVSGPNNGGKTTFARMFGQLHYLASLGLPVPGTSARLFLPDRIFTHFEREEDIETLRGKFDDELVRVHAILEQASSQSVIVMNESFNSTTLNDALYVGTQVMRQILELDCLGVYVTFVDEIASLSEATVSMVSQIVPENPAERTFKVLRKPAEGLAYAWAIAAKYGLSYERLVERIG